MRSGADAKFAKKSMIKKPIGMKGMKGNQGKLRRDIELFVDEHLKRSIGGDFVTQIETVDTDCKTLRT